MINHSSLSLCRPTRLCPDKVFSFKLPLASMEVPEAVSSFGSASTLQSSAESSEMQTVQLLCSLDDVDEEMEAKCRQLDQENAFLDALESSMREHVRP